MDKMKKKIVIASVNGFLGRYLNRWFLGRCWKVVGFSRKGGLVNGAVGVRWDGRNLGKWSKDLSGATALVNLAER